MCKITENWLNIAAFGHMEHYNISNVAPTESHKMSERNIFPLQPFEHKQIYANLPKRRAIAGQRTVGLLLVLNDAHKPINNPTVRIADLRKQNTLLSGNYTTDRRTILHHDGCVFLSPWHTILAIYFSWDYGRSLVLSDLISPHCVPTPLLFSFNNCRPYLKIVIQTHYITFQDINLQPYFKIACVKSVLWPVLNSNVVNVSLSGGSLGYWTACNNFKRYCIRFPTVLLPYLENAPSYFIRYLQNAPFCCSVMRKLHHANVFVILWGTLSIHSHLIKTKSLSKKIFIYKNKIYGTSIKYC